MGNLHGVRRQLATALTLLYLLVAGVLPFGHAFAESPEGAARVHLTELGGDACPPAHDDLHCPACKVAGEQGLASSGPTDGLLGLPGFREPVYPQRPYELSPSPVAVPGSRAPPVA